MRHAFIATVVVVLAALVCPAADLESRALTHYIPQDLLEAAVRKEGWTEIVLKPYDGVKKGDKARIWAGGSIDHGNGNQPGVHVGGPDGSGTKVMPNETGRLALSTNPEQAYALLFKTQDGVVHKCQAAGKALEIPLTAGDGRLWIAFNDLRGRYADNHLGKGRRYELDPLWVRVEVIRIIVD